MQSCIFKRIIPLKTYKNKMFIFATADFSNADLLLYFIFISEKKLKLALSCTLVKWNQYFSCLMEAGSAEKIDNINKYIK